MKINNNNNNYNNYVNGSQKREGPKVERKSSLDKNIDVQISDSTKRLAQSVNLSKDEGISEKVETIKKAILAGTYKVDDKTIAKKIMDNIFIQKGEKLKWIRKIL